MIILDYVTNYTIANPQESQMTTVIMSKRTKGKSNLESECLKQVNVKYLQVVSLVKRLFSNETTEQMI